MVNTSANVLCEVVLVFACMFYHADYYRMIVTAYDYECSQHHASVHVYVCMESEPGTPPPPNTHIHKRTSEEDLWIRTREIKEEK